MSRERSQGGFTLVELLVGIAIGSLVTAAAMSLMLLGVRINRQSTDTVIRQNETRTVLTALEMVANEGSVTKVEIEPDSWSLLGKPNGTDEITLFSYDAESQAIYSGKYDPLGSDNIPILDGVLASFVTVNKKGNLLTFSMETKDGSYNTSVYCRTAKYDGGDDIIGDIVVKDPEAEEGELTDEIARTEFLKVLTSQYRLIGGSPNPGLVLDDEGYSTGKYYSQWYINTTDNPEWNAETPWCACFVSWGLHQIADEYIESIPTGMGYNVSKDKDSGYRYLDCEEGCYHWFASVKRFAEAFQMEHVNTENSYRWENSLSHTSSFDSAYEPVPGDIIFIDWERDDSLDHVGVVLSLVDENPDDSSDKPTHVYTIEGNSAGIVAVRRYPIDSNMIVGYGVIDWKETVVSRTN